MESTGMRPFPFKLESEGTHDTSDCRTPKESLQLHALPYTAPVSLRQYVDWHSDARQCLLDTSCSDKPSVLILRCLPNKPCAGIGDRFRGIVHTFLLAIWTKRVFLIDWRTEEHSAFPLTVAMWPLAIDWRIDGIEQVLPPITTHIDWHHSKNWSRLSLGRARKTNLEIDDFPFLARDLNSFAIVNHAPYSMLTTLTKNQIFAKQFPDLAALTSAQMARLLLKTLFTPSPVVESEVNNAVAGFKGKKFVAIHARTGHDVGETEIQRFQSKNWGYDDTAQALLSCSERVTTMMYENRAPMKRIFAASDSQALKKVMAKEAIKRKISFSSISAQALHIDKPPENFEKASRQEQCKAFLGVFIDVYALSKGSQIVTTGSGFAKLAFLLGNAKSIHSAGVSKETITCKSEFSIKSSISVF